MTTNNNRGIILRRNNFGGMEVQNGNRANLSDSLESAGLNFTVEKQPMFLANGRQVPDSMAIVRKDTQKVLGTVGKKYHTVQNTDAFGVFQEAFDSGLLEVELCGALGGGKIVWVQARVSGDPLIVTGDDKIQPFVLLANSHDGSIALRAGFTAVRLFCYNQMAAATQQGSLVSLKHTRNVNLDSLKSGIEAGRANLAKVVQSARYLSTRKVRKGELDVFTRRSFNLDPEEPSRLDDKIEELFDSGVGAGYRPIRGSWWAAYNAVTEYLTHHRGRDGDSRTKSLWFGDSAKVVGRALDTAIEMAA